MVLAEALAEALADWLAEALEVAVSDDDDDADDAPDGEKMAGCIEHLLKDDKARKQIANNGLESICARHTCAHRAEQLLGICQELGR